MSALIPNANANANLIIPRIWLGNRAAAADEAFIRDVGINVIINASKNIPFLDSEFGNTLHKYRVPVDDNLEESEIANMSKWAPEITYYLLNEYKAGNTILVHCAAGMQRSAAIVAMALIVIKNIRAEDAMKYVKAQRRIAFFPSANFKRSILEFERHYMSIRRGGVAATATSTTI